MTHLKAIALLAFFVSAGLANAQSNVSLGGLAVDTSAAVEVTAESLSIDQAKGTAIFDGDVFVQQGDLKLTAARVEVVYNDDATEIRQMIASGGVTFVTPEEAAEAQNALYDIETGFLTLTGDVLLTQGLSAISAEEMVINVADGTAEMRGRVRTVLQQGGGN